MNSPPRIPLADTLEVNLSSTSSMNRSWVCAPTRFSSSVWSTRMAAGTDPQPLPSAKYTGGGPLRWTGQRWLLTPLGAISQPTQRLTFRPGKGTLRPP